jgi:hypothetical protein
MPDVTLAVNEEAIGRINGHLAANRPSLFNYGTEFVRDNPDRHRVPITGPPPIMTVPTGAPPTVPGTNIVANYIIQITDFQIDFFPQSVITDPLPPNIAATFRENTFLIKTSFWMGLEITPSFPMQHFQLTVFIVVAVAIDGPNRKVLLSVAHRADQEGFEIVDVQPDGLESILEAIARTTITEHTLKKMKSDLSQLVFKAGDPPLAKIELIPSNGTNPVIAADTMQFFFEVAVTDP